MASKHDENTQMFVGLGGKLERAKLELAALLESRVRELSRSDEGQRRLAVYAANRFGLVHDLDVSLAELRFILLRCVRRFNPALGCSSPPTTSRAALVAVRATARGGQPAVRAVFGGGAACHGDKCQRPIEGSYEPDFDRFVRFTALGRRFASDVDRSRTRGGPGPVLPWRNLDVFTRRSACCKERPATAGEGPAI